MGWAEVLSTAALILVSNGVVWGLMNDRLKTAEQKVDSLSGALKGLQEVRIKQTDKRLDGVDLALKGLREFEAMSKGEGQARDLRLKSLEDKAAMPTAAVWNTFVLAVSDSFSTVQSRLDWHVSWLQRLSARRGFAGGDKLLKGDVTLQHRLAPRLGDIELCAEGRSRDMAARSLSAGVGDNISLGRIRRMLGDCPELAKAEERLARRLGEESVSA